MKIFKENELKKVDQNRYFDILEKRAQDFKEKHKGKKVDFEFQEIGLELNKWFGQNCFWILSKPESELQKVKYALKVCQEKKIKKIGYLLGILKNK